MTKDRYYKIVNIVSADNIYFVCYRFCDIDDFYVRPVPSSELGIVSAHISTAEFVTVKVDQIYRKVMCLPIKNRFVLFPLFSVINEQ